MARTVDAISGITKLEAKQVLGEVRASPPEQFLSLLTVSRAAASALWPKLSRVQGVNFQAKKESLLAANADDTEAVTGVVGTENAAALRAAGVAYAPGITVGLSGLEQAYQDSLMGTPEVSAIVVGPGGQQVSTLWTDQGHPGTPVRTTLDSKDQQAAARALSSQHNAGEVIAVNAATGDIQALAAHDGGVPLPPGGPLNARIAPGTAFSIVSAAAMVNAGVRPSTPLPCSGSQSAGGQAFTYTGQRPATFASDFADGCGSAFAGIASKLTPAQLTAAEKGFGIGASWSLPLQAFGGYAQPASAGASLAAQVTGNHGVLMSPLGMALAAAEVDSGTGRAPVLVQSASDSDAASVSAGRQQAPVSGAQLDELRQLMRTAVSSGSARGANVAGAAVYGQAGVVRTGQHAWTSWFVGYRGGLAVAVLQAGSTPQQAAASLAGAFLSAAR
jgi:cell division protein FtsI/penicillin-binding protein 2